MVYITPIISRSTTGQVIPEVGAGGGARDLDQSHNLRLDNLKAEEVDKLIQLCTNKVISSEARSRTVDIISKAVASRKEALYLDALKPEIGEKTMPLDDLVQLLARLADREDGATLSKPDPNIRRMRNERRTRTSQGEHLPRNIVCLSISFDILANGYRNSHILGTRLTKSCVNSSVLSNHSISIHARLTKIHGGGI